MLQSNARIYNDKVIKFYEQDLIVDDYVFATSSQCEINAEYVNTGLGIALISNECLYQDNEREIYICRIGYNECTLYKIADGRTKAVSKKVVFGLNPRQENIKLKLCYDLDYNLLTFFINDTLYIKKTLPTRLDDYVIGYYSNKDNIIKSIDISAKTPDNWFTNMKNTNGGYIYFSDNMYELTDCKDNAEMEQYNILLDSGESEEKTYYLQYKTSEDSDIKAYLFRYDNGYYIDSRKSILKKDNSFIVRGKENLNLKFVGKTGSVKNIMISEYSDDTYSGTESEDYTDNKSCITLNVEQVQQIIIRGKLIGIPKKNEEYYVFKDTDNIFTEKDLNIPLKEEYKLVIDFTDNTFKVNDNEAITSEINPIDNTVKLLCNIDSEIYELRVVNYDGSEMDKVNENLNTISVPGTIKSPIVVTLNNDAPLDLSSSLIMKNDKLQFTNTQREIINPKSRLKLSYSVLNNINSLKLYGVSTRGELNSEYSEDDISKYCNMYDDISDQIKSVNYKAGIITMQEQSNEFYTSKYSYFIIDYVKDNSYCINYDCEHNQYIVDIACNGSTKIYYDTDKQYRIIAKNISNSNYVVMK